MIGALQIARYRGIRDLAVAGFGRVNLIVGRNDCGKTAFIEALQIGQDADQAAHLFLQGQKARLGRLAKTGDFDRFWRPLFFHFDAKMGLSISVSDSTSNAWKTLEVRQGAAPDEIITDFTRHASDLGQDDEILEHLEHLSWSLDLRLVVDGQERSSQQIVGVPPRVRLPPVSGKNWSSWVRSSANIGQSEVRYISELKESGRAGVLLELLREVDARLSGIELLSPGGDLAELFVRLDEATPLMPVALMGEGFQRCLELGVSTAARSAPCIFVDEIENGLHHLVMEPLWRWLATVSKRRSLQVFATTHSEECIHAASRAFHHLDDDGLRVIRLDRLDSGTRATVYDRSLVEAAERTGTEIRG